MVANSIVSLMRSLDVVCRWGGEEFIVYSPNLTPPEIQATIGKRILQFIEQSWFTMDCGQKISVTVSIGCTSIKDGDTKHSFIKRADKAMYQSKTAGRNKLTII